MKILLDYLDGFFKQGRVPNTVRYEGVVFLTGISMVVLGLVLFYLIQIEHDRTMSVVRHSGTFVGLMGIGVSIAGILLYLINRNHHDNAEI